MERVLRTAEVARAVGVHPNTVRQYEAWGLLPPVPRDANNYRRYSAAHVTQMRLARAAMRCTWAGGALRQVALGTVQAAAAGELVEARRQVEGLRAMVVAEQEQAELAAAELEHWARGVPQDDAGDGVTIGQAAQRLGATPDMLRNWERNGLIVVPRDPGNGYRRYGAVEIGRLRVIRTLVRARYSLMAVLRMLMHLDRGEGGDLRQVLDTPRPDEDAVYATDRWLSTLADMRQAANEMQELLDALA